MKLYGNDLWNTATPNSEKSIFTVEKERVRDITEILDEAGVNYCYYVKDNKVTIALAKFAVDKRDADSLAKLPQFRDIHFDNSPVDYVPKTHIIGNTPYRDIKNRHFQNLNTDLALKVAEELNKAGINFSGRTNGKNTTLTINAEDKAKFEGIVSDVVNARQSFSERIKYIDNIVNKFSNIPEENRAIIQPLIDLAYYRDDNYLSVLVPALEESEEYTVPQLEGYVKIFQNTFEPWTVGGFLSADWSKLRSYEHNIELENKFNELTYLKGFNPEQKESLREIIERVPDSILALIDYDFSAENIRKIPDILNDNNGYNNFVHFMADIKNIDWRILDKSIASEEYSPDTAEISYGEFDVAHYSAFENEKGSIYKIPIRTNTGILNRLADSGIVPKDDCKDVYIETDGEDWNKVVIPDRFGNMTNNIDCFDILSENELKAMYQVYFDMERIERDKSAHEKLPEETSGQELQEQISTDNDTKAELNANINDDAELTNIDSTSVPAEERVFDINEYDDPDYYEQQQIADQELQEQNEYSNISIEAAEETQEVNENIQAAEVESVPEEANLETVVAEIGEKEKAFTELVKAEEFSKAGDILKALDILVLQAENLKTDIQQEEITKEDVDKLRDIEPKRKSVQNMLETEVAQTPKFEKLLGEELGEKSPYEMRRGNNDWIKDESSTVSVITLQPHEIPNQLSELRKAKDIERGTFVNRDTGINVIFGATSVNEIIAKAIQDSKRGIFVYARIGAMYQTKELIENSVCFDSHISEFNETNSKHKSPNTLFMHQMYNVVQYDEQFYLVRILIEEAYSTDKNNEINGTLNRVYNLKDMKITPVAANRVCDPAVPDSEVGEDTTTDVVRITIPQLYEIVKEYDQNFYENEQAPGRTERLEEIQAQEDFKNSVEILRSHVSEHEEQEQPEQPEICFNSTEFEKFIPHHMRFKEADLVNGNEMYWVTQGIFTVEDLREFQQAIRDYDGEIKKFYVTPRDLSTSYTFEDDRKKRVLATVTPDEIFTDDYVRAIMEIGLADYLTPKNTDSLVTDSTGNEPEDITLDIPEEKTEEELNIGDRTDDPQIAMVAVDNDNTTDVENTKSISSRNYRIDDYNIGQGTPLERFNNNLAAIRTLKQIETDGRQATPEEQEILSRYVGWGGLAEYFKESNPHYQELRDLLTEDEYDSARSTVLDSFYTSPVVIDSIYTVLQNAGFEGGNILEPSMGVGNFFGRMPQEMQEQSKLFGVEIDSLTGRIAKQLYPEAHIDIKGFEKTDFSDGSFDVAVGNIPFGDYNLQYNNQPFKIHDYFFMQTLDKVKDGGIVAFVTSKGTLDKKDPSFRKLLAERADLLGAVRLPNNSFKSAGTEVTSDIIFLQKRSSPPEKMPEWVNIGASPAGYLINNYFIQHPDMVLGEIVQGNKMYGRTDDTMCIPIEGIELSESLPQAVSKINTEISGNTKAAEPIVDNGVVVPENLRNYSYFVNGKDIYTVVNNTAESLKDRWKRSYTAANIERAEAYIQIHDTVRELLAVQQETAPDVEERIKTLQEKLNIQYDNFYEKYGLMHSRFNAQLFNDDTSYPLMLSLEEKIDNEKLVKKSDIFYKRTIKAPQVVESVDTPLEALTLSVAEHGKIDFEYMSALTSLPQETIIKQLRNAGEIFPSPELSTENNIVYQTASEYLSGNIYSKIDGAKIAAEKNDIFADNIKALESVIPAPLKAGEIDVECGATWIPKEIYQQFMYETFKTPRENNANMPKGLFYRNKRNIEVDYSPVTNRWYISNKSADNSVTVRKTYGTEIKNAYHIFESVLNLSTPNITRTRYENGKPITEMDLDATKLVQKKAEAIKKQFKDWIFKDPKRRKELVDLYNRQFNCVRPREYDGSNLQFHGMNAGIELHGHQKNAIAHAIYGGNTLFAHCVGAGKTYEMIATAMESKRLGLCSKSLFAVPNHLTEQVGADFMKLYPNANILVATKKDFTKQNRSKLLAKIATGNYDAVIIGHSQLGMIPISPERQRKMYKEQIREITEGIKELESSDPKNFQVKQLERTKKSLQQKLEKLNSGKRDDTVYFEELGIDKLFVDEAHEFKNLMCVTKLKNVSGISGRTSQRATELFMKCRYLDEKTGGKGVVFATGTPVSNSVTELHTMMRYLEYDFLLEHGLQNFDNWVSVFGKQKTDYELAPTGDKFKARTRIANYANMPELMTMFKQIADVKTADSLKLPVPECELHIVNAEPTELQQNMVQELSARADDVQTGVVEPYEDNMLKITGDGRKVGLDPRLIDPTLEDNPNTKLNQCVNNVFKIWQDTAEEKMTQIIFCDLGVPKPGQDEVKENDVDEKSMSEIDSLEESGRFCIYDDIKNKLVAMCVPKNEIAFIHDAKTEAQKSELFEKVRSGDVRVLIGSTAKMGTGTNVQDRLIALHDLDVPWRPADLEQRKGRMVRQGNINDKVHLYRYVTKGTFDAYSYQLLETKQRFISQVITSKTPARTCSDVDQEALTYSEIKALCTGDERIKEKLVLENRVKELTLFEKEYKDTHYELEDKVEAYPKRRQLLCDRIAKIEKDSAKSSAIPLVEDGTPLFKMTVRGIEYTNRKDAAEALRVAASAANRNRDAAIEIGELYGFKISVTYDSINECIRGIVQGETQYNTSFGVLPSANLNKLEKVILGTGKVLEDEKAKLVKEDLDIEAAKEILAVPFEFEQELHEKSERLSELTDELNAEAAERARNGAKAPRTHYFSKDMFLSSKKKEAPKQAQEISKEQEKKADKGVAI